MAERLAGRVAVVTGAAGGFGRVLVRALLDEGARVAALDVDEAGLGALGESLRADHDPSRWLAARTDISRYAECEAAIARALDRLGGLDILINNAAIGMGAIRADHLVNLVGIEEITPQMWERFVATNVSGAWHMTRAAVGHLLGQRRGRIVNVTTSFFTMLRGRFHPYGPCKAALEAMSAGHADEFAGTGVTVNIVVPGGPADTPMVPPESGFDRRDLIAPSVMAPPVLWLCSDAAAGVTGNRYVAAQWDAGLPPEQAAAGCAAPVAWPGLAQSPVWPGGRPGG